VALALGDGVATAVPVAAGGDGVGVLETVDPTAALPQAARSRTSITGIDERGGSRSRSPTVVKVGRWLGYVNIYIDGPAPIARTRRPGGGPGRDPRGTLALMTETAIETPTFRHFIAGEWCDSTSGETFESRNPADTRDVVGRFQQGTKADVAMAIKAAETAFPMWRRTPAPKRGEILYAFGALLAQHKERLARAMTREMGKVIAEARGDVQEGIDIAYLMAGEGRRMAGDTVPSELPDKWAMSIRQPLGVAGIITPWNFPMAIPCWKTMPALVTGNTVVFKPSSDTPHCATILVELMAEAGFPPGVVNLVTGTGEEVGDSIVDSPDIAVISFTGSSATGKGIAARAGRRLKRVSLELGGKNGVVVLADADLDLATDGILWSAFGTTGQRCTAASRVIVERPVVEALLERLEARARTLRLGSGLDPAVDVGPLINAGAAEKVASYVDIGRGEGDLVIGGGRASSGDLMHGHFFEPTIFSGVAPMDRIGQEEIFGPVLSIIPVEDYGAAMLALNQTRYGLSSSIFTRDVNQAFRAMRDFETGIVYVNAGTTGAEVHLPFGGWKETGNGHREAGHVALDTYTEWKSIYVDFSGRLQRAQIDNQPG
jgi:alpha-ketoglutaric semialdehyde dehydrogenase